MEKIASFNDVETLAISLARTASVTDSPGEKAFPAFLHTILAQIPYFKNNQNDIEILPIPGDPKERSNIFALARGSGSCCVVLTGHYDVVQTSMYGSLEPWAFDPKTLLCKTLEQLGEASGKDSPGYKLKEDLASGEFLPGRGLLDMKSGLAAGISVLARFAAQKQRHGNILFLAVADEEGSSHGMKAASPLLVSYLAERGMHLSAVFNLDSAIDQESGELGRAVFTGSVGKTLPFVYFVGKCTHAGSPFDGINPVMAASAFAMEIECNPDALREKQAAPGEEAPPPTILYFRESRSNYDVTTPPSVFCALNVLSHTREPAETLDSVGKIALNSMNKAISALRERASTLSRRVSGHFSLPSKQPEILDFGDLARLAERNNPGVLEKVRAYARSQEKEDLVLRTLIIVQELVAFAGIEGPAAITGFAPPYYARVELDQEKNRDFVSMLRSVLSEYSIAIGKSIRVRPYFPGISDMSFLSPADSVEQRAFVKDKSALGNDELGLPIKPLECPVLNVGPWGRDYHQAGERVHREYSFVELPELVWRLVIGTLDLSCPQPSKPLNSPAKKAKK